MHCNFLLIRFVHFKFCANIFVSFITAWLHLPWMSEVFLARFLVSVMSAAEGKQSISVAARKKKPLVSNFYNINFDLFQSNDMVTSLE